MELLSFEGVKCVLLDIEGTVCPISFVKDTLFPYALKALPEVLKSNWDDPEFKPYRDAFPEDAQESPEVLQAHVEDLTKRDVKIAYLKNLQGYLWEEGYKSGAYATPLFPDVSPKLKEWKDAEIQLAIYSSGSVFAQKLLFGHVKVDEQGAGQKRTREAEDDFEDEQPKKRRVARAETADDTDPPVDSAVESARDEVDETAKPDDVVSETFGETDDSAEIGTLNTEDLQDLISDWFDTTNAGLKTESGSYERIADALKSPPKDILFLSDNVKEVDAAVHAGMQAALVDRPGNAPVSDTDRERLSMVETFDEIDVIEHELVTKNEDS